MRVTLLICILATSPLWAESEKISIRGKALCLGSEGKVSHSTDTCTVTNGFVFKTTGGTEYRLSSSDQRVQILSDPRVRDQELEIEGWLRNNDNVEIIKLYSIKGGDRYHPHYFCATCNITAYTPGLCWCCEQPFEFREIQASNTFR